MPQARFSSASPSQALSGQERDLGITWIAHSTYFLVVDKPQLSASSIQETAIYGACMVATILRTAPDLFASSAGHCALSPVPPSVPNTCKMKKDFFEELSPNLTLTPRLFEVNAHQQPHWMCAEQEIQIMPNQCQDKPWIPKKVKLCLKSYHSYLPHWCFRKHHLPHWVGAEQGSSSLSSPSQGFPPGPGAGFVHDLRKE